ncbi:hypothetical protein ACL6C3_13925 [Capilliphycus salinus ALCB114379]|uniref:hypothetical protein n=1 Tax=Capilliphycus salinus TaxID=2768948 RepID=UPI0039A754BE
MTLFTHRIQQYEDEIASLHQKINALQSEQDKLRKNENNAASALKILEDVVQEFGDDGEVMQSLKEKLDALFAVTTDGESEMDNLPSNKFQEYHSTLRFQNQNEADLFANEARKRGICHNFESFSDGSMYVFGVSDEDALNRLIDDQKSAKIDVPEAKPTAISSANSELLHAHPMIFFDAYTDSMRLFLFAKDDAIATYEKAKEAGLAKQHELHKLNDTWLLVLSPVNRDTALKIKELALEESSPKAIATAPQIAIEPSPQPEPEAIAIEPNSNTEELSEQKSSVHRLFKAVPADDSLPESDSTECESAPDEPAIEPINEYCSRCGDWLIIGFSEEQLANAWHHKLSDEGYVIRLESFDEKWEVRANLSTNHFTTDIFNCVDSDFARFPKGYEPPLELKFCDSKSANQFGEELITVGLASKFDVTDDGTLTIHDPQDSQRIRRLVETETLEKEKISDVCYRRGDVLVIGFKTKKLRNEWKSFFDVWLHSANIKAQDYSRIDGLKVSLSIINYAAIGDDEKPYWERIKQIDFTQNPEEVERQRSLESLDKFQQVGGETPTSNEQIIDVTGIPATVL